MQAINFAGLLKVVGEHRERQRERFRSGDAQEVRRWKELGQPYFLSKMDVEGAEFSAFKAAVGENVLCQKYFNHITIEWHPWYASSPGFGDEALRRRWYWDMMNNAGSTSIVPYSGEGKKNALLSSQDSLCYADVAQEAKNSPI